MAPSVRSARTAAISALLFAGSCVGPSLAAGAAIGDECALEGGCPLKGQQMLATRMKSKMLEVAEGAAHEESWHGLAGMRSARDLDKMASTLQKLARGVVEGTEEVSDTQKEVLKSIKDEMEAIINAILASHQEDQGEVDRAKSTSAGCSVPAEVIEASRKDTHDKETGHGTCRNEEMTLKAEMGAACNLYHSIATNQNMPPCMATYNPTPERDQFDAMHACLEKIIEWSVPLEESLTLNRKLCNDAKAKYDKKVKDCNTAQSTYEMGFCSYHETLTGACSKYATCRALATKQATETHEAVKVAEAGRKAEYKAAQHIKCFLDVFDAAPADQPKILQGCLDAAITTTQFDISYHEEPPQVPCDVTPVATYPCEATWLNQRYESKDWFTEAPTVACTACVHLSPAAAPGPTPAPATA